MMTVGTPISASGAEAYFKADFIKQEKLLKMSADENDEADENTSIRVIADAKGTSSVIKDSETEDSDGENPTVFKDENSIAESDSVEKSGNERLQEEKSTAKDSAAEDSIVNNPNIEILGVETPGIENSNDENANIEKLNSDENKTDFAQTRTIWIGKLSEELGLTGNVAKKDFAALARGVHPQTGERFIRHVKPRTVTDEKGKTRQTKSHRAGLDQTLNAPKSVSIVAPYDDRIIVAHWRAAVKAVEAIEEFTTAKMGNIKAPELTGKAAYAAFTHFEARPDFKNNFAAPDLHTHFFEFNFVFTADGRYRALETREIYRCQKLATAVYRAELLKEMTVIGYEMRIDEKTGAPEIASISRPYIEASSPRQTEIKRTAAELGIKSTKIVASNYRRGKNFDLVDMRRRWNLLDLEFGSQAASAAEQARHRTEAIRIEKQTLSSHRQTPDSLKAAEQTRLKTAAAVDFAIAQAKEQKDIEVSKRKWITRQSLLTEALNYSPAELTIDTVKAEFSEREKKGELEEFKLDRRKQNIQAERGNTNVEKLGSAPIISEATTNEQAIKSNESSSFGNLEDTKANDEWQPDRPREFSVADTKIGIENSLLTSDIQKSVVPDQVIEINPAITARLETFLLASETVIKDSSSVQPLFDDRTDFAQPGKSIMKTLPLPEQPKFTVTQKKIKTGQREISEITLEINQNSEESFETIYDKTGILQSRTRTSDSRRGESDIAADLPGSGKYNARVFSHGEPGNGDNTFESNIIDSINDDTADHSVAITSSSGAVGSESNLTDSGSEHHRENGHSATGTRAGAEQNSTVGRRERELPDRGGIVERRGSDVQRIAGRGIEKNANSGGSNRLSFKPIDPAVRNENTVRAEPDLQPTAFEMEAASRRESDAGVERIEIARAESAPLRDYRANDEAARSGQEITGNDRENFRADERDGADYTSVDAEGERGLERGEKRDGEVENRHRKIEFGANTIRTAEEFGGTAIEDKDERTGTLSNQVTETQIANGEGFESQAFADARTSDGSQRAAGNRTSIFGESIGEDERADGFDSATNTEGEGIGDFKRAEIRETGRMDGSLIEMGNRAAGFSDAGSGVLLWSERVFEREPGSGETEDRGAAKSVNHRAKGQNGSRTEFQQHDNDAAADISAGRAAL